MTISSLDIRQTETNLYTGSHTTSYDGYQTLTFKMFGNNKVFKHYYIVK